MLEKLVKRIKPKHYPFVAFALGCIAMFVMLSYAELLSSGRFTVFNGDEFKLYSYIRMILTNLLNGESIRYSFTTSLGMDTSLILAYDFFSPFNIVYLLLYQADPRVAIALVFILKTGTAAMAFQLFAARGMKSKGIGSVIWAVFYSMCAFGVFFGLCNNMWADALYLLPLVCLCLTKGIHEKKYYLLAAVYAVTFIIQFYMGYMIGIFTFLLFVLLMVTEKKLSGKEKGIHFALYFASVLTAICISAIVWVPALFWILKNTASDTGSFASASVNLFDLGKRLFFGEASSTYNNLPNLYCGIPCLILLPGFFFKKEISLREKLTAGLLLLFYILCIFIVPLNALMHALDIPDGFAYRYSFVISFLLCLIAVRTFELSDSLPKLQTIIVLCVLGLCYLVGMTETLYNGEAGLVSSAVLCLLNIVLTACWIGLFHLKKTKKTLAAVMLVLLAVAESAGNGVVLWKGLDKLPETAYENWSGSMKEILADPDMQKNDFRIAVQNDLCDDSDSFFGYNGIVDFGTAEIPSQRDFMRKMGFFTSAKLIHATGITPVTEMILGVKYRYTADNPYRIIGEREPVKKSENPYCLPLGYAVNPEIAKLTLPEGNAFENQNALIQAMTGIENVYERIPMKDAIIEEEGLHLENTLDGMRLIREDVEEAAIRFTIPFDDSERVFLQFGYEHPGLYFASPVAEAAGNIMNLDMGAQDGQIRGAAVYELKDTDNGKFLLVKSYVPEDCPVSLKDIYLYRLNREKLREGFEILNENGLQISERKAGIIKGSVKVTKENRVLMLSVPYLEGWTATLNGKSAEVIPVADGTFIGIRLPESGTYDAEFRYRNPYLKYGCIMSLLGAVMLASLWVSLSLTRHRES